MKQLMIAILFSIVFLGCVTSTPPPHPIEEYIEKPIVGIKKILPWNWSKQTEYVKSTPSVKVEPLTAKEQLSKDFSAMWLVWFISIGGGIALIVASKVMGKDFLTMGIMAILCGIAGPVLVYIAKVAAVWIGICVVVIICLGLIYIVCALYKKHKKEEKHFGQLVKSFQASKGKDWEDSKEIAQIIQDEEVQDRVKKHKSK